MRSEARAGRMRALLGRAREACDQILGIPSYDGYVEHLRRCHPEREPMNRAAFFRDRQAAQYGNAKPGCGRCC